MTSIRRFIAGALPLVLLLALALPAGSTVNTSANKTIAAGNGSQTVFTFNFIGVASAYISVVYTDASGNQTTLSQGSGSTQYQISLNAPVQGAIWGAGGTVTYNPSGTPIANGTTLTIVRTLPLTQAVTLQNQQSVQTLGKGAETAVDTAVMQDQQTAEQIGRALQMNASNSAAPNPLPPAAQAAGMGLCFDGTGNNVVACSLAPSGSISSAMAPVVNAASLAVGRTALGLGAMATEGIGAGLQDDGAGNARVTLGQVSDASNQAVTSAFHLTQRVASGSIIYTLPRGNTLFSGFGFWVTTGGNTVTFAINANDSFNGATSGASFILPPGVTVFVNTNALTNATWWTTGITSATPNWQLNAAVASNALTIALKDRNGNDPSANSPVMMSFRDPALTGGDPVMRAVTGALSIVVPSTATVGTVNAQPNRLWVGWMDNAGTPALCVYNSLNTTGPSIVAWDETSPATGTLIAGGSNNPQTWYCNGAVSAKALRILGYVESTQPTAGTWSATPTKIMLFGPGVKRPGDVVGQIMNKVVAAATTTSGPFVALTSESIVIPVQNAANLIRVEAYGLLAASASVTTQIQLSRGTTGGTNLIGNVGFLNVTAGVPSALLGFDTPNTTGNVTYAVQGSIGGGNTLTYGGNVQIAAAEIQI